ncbi:restriction endonuclease [Salinicoccus roseus]|jgi:restriction system protein|uniref:restriction endonuclease n=1 Tax=Salinicoccus roseus TaxID=45670 RepID=UPI000F4DEF73|nr:restriction endonuclease [Salinicoccus roseus]RPE51812.1 restriction system protein [Salinicoccus roseus]GGA75925.1 restriction endonuclease [Salinicoccus roseus]
MTVWLFRAGKNGEYENKFLEDNRIYLTWDSLNFNLKSIESKELLVEKLMEHYDIEKKKTAINWASQIWPMARKIDVGDYIALPSKLNRTIHIGVVKSQYIYDENLENPYFHYREVDWIKEDIPRERFDQDILYSLGAFMTVCKIQRNNAEERIKEMKNNGWQVPKNKRTVQLVDESEEPASIDIEEFIYDQISERIIRKFKGSKMETLIEEILKAQGFTTFKSPEGSDHGVDILASSDLLGFGSPRICVQVKTEDSPLDRPTLDQLVGTMSNFNADYGLLVSWSGFKSSVTREVPKHFFKVRLWDSKTIIQQIFEHYDNLSDDIKNEIPIKRVWMLDKEIEE